MMFGIGNFFGSGGGSGFLEGLLSFFTWIINQTFIIVFQNILNHIFNFHFIGEIFWKNKGKFVFWLIFSSICILFYKNFLGKCLPILFVKKVSENYCLEKNITFFKKTDRVITFNEIAEAKKFRILDEENEFLALSLYDSGELYCSFGNYKKAVECYEISLNLSQNNKLCLFELGICYFKLEDYEKAILAFKKVVMLDSDDVMTWYYMALASYKLNDYSNSLRYSENALRFNSSCFEALNIYEQSVLHLEQENSFDVAL